jgi:hypothetical protein
MHAAEHAGDLMRQRIVDVADEAQRQVIILGVDPARPGQAAAHHGERLGNGRWNFQTGKQTGHHLLPVRCGESPIRRMG